MKFCIGLVAMSVMVLLLLDCNVLYYLLLFNVRFKTDMNWIEERMAHVRLTVLLPIIITIMGRALFAWLNQIDTVCLWVLKPKYKVSGLNSR